MRIPTQWRFLALLMVLTCSSPGFSQDGEDLLARRKKTLTQNQRDDIRSHIANNVSGAEADRLVNDWGAPLRQFAGQSQSTPGEILWRYLVFAEEYLGVSHREALQSLRRHGRSCETLDLYHGMANLTRYPTQRR